MYLLGIALLVLLFKVLELPPVASWSWWWVLAPFGVAFLWFEFGESLTGFDKKRLRALDQEVAKKERIRKMLQRNVKSRH
jgi:small Trp-rich protein